MLSCQVEFTAAFHHAHNGGVQLADDHRLGDHSMDVGLMIVLRRVLGRSPGRSADYAWDGADHGIW
jgi:hypothetical protein